MDGSNACASKPVKIAIHSVSCCDPSCLDAESARPGLACRQSNSYRAWCEHQGPRCSRVLYGAALRPKQAGQAHPMKADAVNMREWGRGQGRLQTICKAPGLVRMGRVYAACCDMPWWRSNASSAGSRPRKALKDSIAGRLPPASRILCR